MYMKAEYKTTLKRSRSTCYLLLPRLWVKENNLDDINSKVTVHVSDTSIVITVPKKKD